MPGAENMRNTVPDPAHPNAVSIAILAGGKSNRIGTNKALLQVGESTLIERVVAAAKTCDPRPAIITNTPAEFSFLNLPMIADEVADAGPLGGIYTALKHCRTSHCLVLACDLPFVSADIVRYLAETGPAHEALVLRAANGPEPLCATYSESCLPVIRRHIDKQTFKVQEIFSEIKVEFIAADNGRIPVTRETLHNVNTVADWEQAKTYLSSKDQET